MAVKLDPMRDFQPFLAGLVLTLAVASAAFAAPPAGKPYGEQQLRDVKYGRPGVIALIDGKGPFTFIIDTATSQTILSEGTVARLGASAQPGAQVTVTTASGPVSSQIVRVRDVATAGVTLEHLDAVKAPISDAIGADGILGSDFLSNFTIDLDWPAGKFRLFPSGALPNLDGFRTARGRVDTRRLLLFAGACRSTRCNVVLDTGALISLGNLALGRVLPPAGEPVAAIDYLEVNGLKASGIQARAKTLTQLRVGEFSWINRDVAIVNSAVFDLLDEPSRPTLFLGLDILGKGRLVVDYEKGVMYFKR
jgi:hypothetical protein